MVSPCFENDGEIGADQDIEPELREYINWVFSKGDNTDHKDGGRITDEMTK